MVAQKPESSNVPLMYDGILPQEEMLEIGKKHKKLTIGIPKDNHNLERRVSLTPEAVEVLVNNGHDVLMETKAGEGARYSDTDYSEGGGFIIENKKQVLNADIIIFFCLMFIISSIIFLAFWISIREFVSLFEFLLIIHSLTELKKFSGNNCNCSCFSFLYTFDIVSYVINIIMS